MKRIIQKPLFWILIASIIPVLNLLTPGMPFVHDGQDHVARIANFYAALKDGIIVPRWAGSLNWGYGHPILMFLYPFPEYLASAVHFVGFSLVDSTKLVLAVSFVASAVTMYLWMAAAFGTQVGVIGALLYSFAPYRFVDLYVRGALGEHVAFVFPPLVLYCLRKRSFTGASLALAALILSHNALALMFLPIIGLYGVYLLLFEEKHRFLFIIYYSLCIVVGFGLSAFFWLPAILEGRFTLRDIVTAGEALKHFVPWSWFVYSPWNFGQGDELSKALGLPQWIGVIAAVAFLLKSKLIKSKLLVAASLILLLTSFAIMTNISRPIWSASKLLQDFQFPWRFLSVSVFVAAVGGGIGIDFIVQTHIREKFRRTLFIVIFLGIIGATGIMWHPKGYQTHDDSFYSRIYPGTTDTGESAPIWSVRFMEHTAANPIDVADGDASVKVDKRTTTEHDYTLTVRKPSLMVENTLYFPGWMIYLNNLPTGIEWQNPDYRGLMTFRVTPGTVHVRVVFEDTKIRRVANMISLLTLALMLLAGIGIFVWQKRKHYR